ncbi:unnamed protein product, partial [Iphiclides podalirius]
MPIISFTTASSRILVFTMCLGNPNSLPEKAISAYQHHTFICDRYLRYSDHPCYRDTGPVGSIVGQIARINGFKVGFTGSDDKVQWLEKELGFNKAINYKTVDVSKALKEAAPGEVDCYFENSVVK